MTAFEQYVHKFQRIVDIVEITLYFMQIHRYAREFPDSYLSHGHIGPVPGYGVRRNI